MSRRAFSVSEVLAKKRKLLEFDGAFEASFGKPELRGAWFIWGDSRNGKTSFVMQLCKYLTRFERVAYNSMEEGNSESIKIAFQRVGMSEVKRRLILLDNEPIEAMKERLRRHKAPKIVVIDSIQYSRLKYDEYAEMRDEFSTTLFIIISHASGKNPRGAAAESIMYDAFVKIYVEGFKAFVTSRYGGGEPFVIWPEKAAQYHPADNF